MIKLFPCDGHLYTILELEERLKFQFSPQNTFESAAEKEEILQRGLEKLKKNAVCARALELGERFRDKIQASYLSLVSIRWVDEKVGYGLFAEEDLEPGSYVGEYTGLVRKNDRLYFEPLNNYCYEYPVPDSIGRSYVIDGTSGHLTRFLNHSDQPNVKPEHVFYEGFYHLIFLAADPIKKGTQLKFHYGQNYWALRRKPIDL